ncbi:phosphoribosylaminoimidazole synthetase [cyanobacterium endosymbiont of Rhopalodia gibberula]|uniref:phosphoribosylformylglycinamidine cyclo-ligase n=1 Tax=cyanobacterium endosymbiont of Rhopalodia gibberula TaxID=1763363 RepID=UPI000DC732E7|nr:phosphoribosylformylglycinamidine cyclo-ligase [cyanobacterium endosymbiont of Rhopalodia gibberula]BBA80311.1 phosphoribosylaminoimidazole synthetase [cyanobacterium endosymbiont of Rhopalodia gibberula]
MDYREAGVDIQAGRSFVEKIRQGVESTYRREVLGRLGGFGGYFELPQNYRNPVLVSGTDGVGTKLKIAQTLNQHHTIGIDLVAMCVNDVLTCGAEPLFFLDYLATGKLNLQQLSDVVQGIVEGCRLSDCTLLGGETAEMPGFYQVGKYDVAGFCVGIVEKDKILDGSKVKIGDIAIGLASSGVHSNGFSLIRKIVEINGLDWSDGREIFDGQTLGEVLLTPTQLYVKPILEALKLGIGIHAMAHITGGGLPENLPRCLNKGQSVVINPKNWEILPIFRWISQSSNISQQSLLETFNMGIGFVVIVSSQQTTSTLNFFERQGIPSYQIGKVVEGTGEVIINS